MESTLEEKIVERAERKLFLDRFIIEQEIPPLARSAWLRSRGVPRRPGCAHVAYVDLSTQGSRRVRDYGGTVGTSALVA